MILIACPSGPTIQKVSVKKTKHLELSDTSGKFSRIVQIYIKKLINNYAFEKTKHLELSDSFLEHSQIFSDSI